jgi:hypothetical protein
LFDIGLFSYKSKINNKKMLIVKKLTSYMICKTKTKTGKEVRNMSKTPMTTAAAARIQAAEAKAGNGGVESGSFASKAQRAAAQNGKSNFSVSK